ncbi:ribulose-phosphate 3-epimerase [Subdoligranulum variabile]|uniref:Ribulose-phosphate 3-epimerase n=1 Tax=Subdoligranulum variabile DSM 15176 TaxID=411471 RepID=D1PJM9_9FIRM|nr:ribulose-phosphate 3-epimerase [Subdoligranulum variabile]EFB76977.1 ribulose-phosphate 3-epimerase [Subdoligranulum variabile DSM 15176]UWP67645.1 ribulose-phosphate 3-epimerase [Subdoligranulum variabile]
MTKIAASILSADFANLQHDCTRLLQEGADLLHIDVMDGHFVPNISYGAPVLQCLHKALPDAYYDVHLMISDPARYAADFAKAGAGLITFHLEAVPDTAEEVIAAIRATGCQVGISIRPGTPVEAAFPYLGVVDLILVMSVEPGFGGQKFLPGTPQRLAALDAERKRRGCATILEVDGGINAETGPLCVQAGADWLVAGSSLFHAADPAAVVRLLHGQA